MTNLLTCIRNGIAQQGLEFFGVTDLLYPDDVTRLRAWLAAGQHAGMAYLTENQHCRENPEQLLPGARSAIVVGFNYFLGKESRRSGGAKIAQYARWRDYHKFMRQKLESVGDTLQKAVAAMPVTGFSARILVDSAPLLERALAKKTGVGFIGKNSMFIHRQKGSFFLLGEILTTLPAAMFVQTQNVEAELTSSETECGTCRRCQTHCPTGALQKDFTINANLCLSYWTIEHRGTIPETFWPHLAEYVFGCDICQMVCPFNRDIDTAKGDTHAKHIGNQRTLSDIATMTQSDYEAWFGGTALTRAKRSGLRRNAIVALAVQRYDGLMQILTQIENEPDCAPVLLATAQQIRRYWRSRDPCMPCHTPETTNLFQH